MNRISKSLAVALLGGGAVVGSFFGTAAVQNVRFAHAAEQVQASREQLAQVDSLSTVFREIGKVVEPSVVKIDVRKAPGAGNRQLPFDDEMLRRLFPDTDGDGEPDLPENFGPGEGFGLQGTGSGVIMETQGKTAFIVTNNHVAGGASEIRVSLADGRVVEN